MCESGIFALSSYYVGDYCCKMRFFKPKQCTHRLYTHICIYTYIHIYIVPPVPFKINKIM